MFLIRTLMDEVGYDDRSVDRNTAHDDQTPRSVTAQDPHEASLETASASDSTANAQRELFDRIRRRPAIRRVRDELVVAHLNLVRYLASRFANRGEPLEDLMQVGTLGLIKAIDRFDPQRGSNSRRTRRRRSSARSSAISATKAGRSECRAGCKSSSSPSTARSTIYRAQLGRSPSVADLAQKLGATEEEIIEAQELGQAYEPLSLDIELGRRQRRQSRHADRLRRRRETRTSKLLENRDLLERAFERARPARTRHRLSSLLRTRLAIGDRTAPARVADARLAAAAARAREDEGPPGPRRVDAPNTQTSPRYDPAGDPTFVRRLFRRERAPARAWREPGS